MPAQFEQLAEDVLQEMRGLGLKIATAESCTGGLVAAALTSVAGSSDVFERGFVTYSNEAKAQMLGVDPAMIRRHGAVSREVAIAMAHGALRTSRAHLSVAVTGIAGPGGGSPEKPVGLVHFAAARAAPSKVESHSVSLPEGTAARSPVGEKVEVRGNAADAVIFTVQHEERFGDIGRAEVRAKSVETALRLLLSAAAIA